MRVEMKMLQTIFKLRWVVNYVNIQNKCFMIHCTFYKIFTSPYLMDRLKYLQTIVKYL